MAGVVATGGGVGGGCDVVVERGPGVLGLGALFFFIMLWFLTTIHINTASARRGACLSTTTALSPSSCLGDVYRATPLHALAPRLRDCSLSPSPRLEYVRLDLARHEIRCAFSVCLHGGWDHTAEGDKRGVGGRSRWPRSSLDPCFQDE
jgi:hypothetical protein